MDGFHHLRARMRAEPFPAHLPWKRLLDYIMYAVGLIQPIALVPQVIAIYSDHATQGVSPLTWAMLTGFNVLWAFYGLAHKDKIIFFANGLMAALDLTIVLGLFR